MAFSTFHFAQGDWLWGLLVIPLVLSCYALFYRRSVPTKLLERYVDRELLPHLLKNPTAKRHSLGLPLFLWSLAWLCGVLAMAGPRWNYTEEQTFRTGQNLVIVLELSQSMNAQDVKPSRVARAREEIQDLLDLSQGAAIGLVAYAAVPHMVTPITDDVRTIRNLLPALDTSLVTVEGNRLKPALQMARAMLDSQAGEKAILVIGDGEFEDTDLDDLAHAAAGAAIYTMGIGTAQGAPVPLATGGWLKDDSGKLRISHLQTQRLEQLASLGHGLYVEANYTDSDTRAILSHLAFKRQLAPVGSHSVRVWQEHFYLPLLVLALLLIPFFRRGSVFPMVILMAVYLPSAGHAEALPIDTLFLNKQQQAKALFDKGDFQDAMEKFDTDYRRGVAAYRAGQYEKAANWFQAAAVKSKNLDALYNLGNAQLMQDEPENAIASYKAVLKQRPHDLSAQHNLAIAEAMLKRKPNQPKDNNSQKQDQNNSKNQGGKQTGNNQKSAQNNAGQKNDQGQQNQGSKNQPSSQHNNATGQNQQKQDQKNQGQKGQAQQNPGQQNRAQQAQSRGAKGQQAPNQASRQKPGNQQNASRANPQSAGKQQSQPPRLAQASPAKAGSPPPGDRNAAAVDSTLRPQRDIDADEWLSRIQSDPSSFLKNQFAIEDREATQAQTGEK